MDRRILRTCLLTLFLCLMTWTVSHGAGYEYDAMGNLVRVAISTGTGSDPVALDGTLTIYQGQAKEGVLRATDIDCGAFTFRVVSNGSEGTAVITDAVRGYFKYTADPDASSHDTFTFKVKDDTDRESNTATVAVTINPLAGSAPVAENGELTMYKGETGKDVLKATDPDGDSLTFSIVTNGKKGPVTITGTATGNYEYTPMPTYSGSDSFTFMATETETGRNSNIATVKITILPSPIPLVRLPGPDNDEDQDPWPLLFAQGGMIYTVSGSGRGTVSGFIDPSCTIDGNGSHKPCADTVDVSKRSYGILIHNNISDWNYISLTHSNSVDK